MRCCSWEKCWECLGGWLRRGDARCRAGAMIEVVVMLFLMFVGSCRLCLCLARSGLLGKGVAIIRLSAVFPAVVEMGSNAPRVVQQLVRRRVS